MACARNPSGDCVSAEQDAPETRRIETPQVPAWLPEEDLELDLSDEALRPTVRMPATYPSSVLP